MSALRRLFDHALRLIFPTARTIGKFSTITPEALARTATQPIVSREVDCLAPLPFENEMVRTAVHAAKYQRNDHAARLLGITLSPFLAEEIAERRMLGAFIRPLVVPIPLHPTRLRERGYNQSERIAAAVIAEISDPAISLAPALLERVVNTAHQARQVAREDRLKNLEGAFMVPDPALVRGRDIIVLDDVITTGATLASAKDALLAAGARDVLCVAVAH